MTENKNYEITFTTDTEVTFYDKNHKAITRVVNVGEKITATFIGVNATNEKFRDFRCGKELFSVSVYTFDSIRVAHKKQIKIKQVTVVVEIAIALEVPMGMDINTIKDMVKNNTTWDVNSEHPDAKMVDVSDILGITSITEASCG